MQLPYVNGGKPFTPKTTVRDVLALLQQPILGEKESIEATIAFCLDILRRTDPSVKENALLDLPPWELTPLRRALLTRPKEEALGESQPPPGA